MSTLSDAVRAEAMGHVMGFIENSPSRLRANNGTEQVFEALVMLIAKRDERIEALERRLAALEGDAK